MEVRNELIFLTDMIPQGIVCHGYKVMSNINEMKHIIANIVISNIVNGQNYRVMKDHHNISNSMNALNTYK